MRNQFNFTELMCKVDAVADLNTKELLLWKALTVYEQTVLYTDDYFMQVKSEIGYLQKEKELLPATDEIQQKSNNLKISTCIVFQMLNLLGKGKNVNDLTNMSLLASIVTGFSKDNILNTVQKGFHFSKQYHGAIIQEVNEVLQRLRMPLIDIAQKY